MTIPQSIESHKIDENKIKASKSFINVTMFIKEYCTGGCYMNQFLKSNYPGNKRKTTSLFVFSNQFMRKPSTNWPMLESWILRVTDVSKMAQLSLFKCWRSHEITDTGSGQMAKTINTSNCTMSVMIESTNINN